MRILCRIFGHKADRHQIQLDPMTFKEQSRCARCAAPLIHDSGRGWVVVSDES